MADYSKFKNVNGDDLVLQDSRVDAISEKVEGIETGAEVNKVESISIEGTEFVPDENKCINIGLYSGTGGLAWDEDEGLYIPTQYPLYRGTREHPGIYFGYDNSTLELNDDDVLSVANPVPDNTTGEGDILCWQSGSDFLGIEPHAVWCSPDSNDILVDTTNGEIRLAVPVPDPKGSHQANDGDVLTYDANSDEIVWAAPQGGGIELPPLPTENATGGGLDETLTRIKLVGECNYEDHFTLKWEYE
jgi:hypothetical protein